MARMIIVDSSAFMRGALKFIVENFGNEVIGSTDTGQNAIELCTELKPDMLIIEISIREGMDGITTMKELKKINNRILVIVTFAPGEENLAEDAKTAGAVGQISKPFLAKNIGEELGRILKSK
ncbi:MAG: response regulator [Desulfobacterium sp.]|nr:response regulator [Desulfobacterium sp.]MBU3949010.1 response regulator [Pseudomonadota bacterium]MBU4010710.1 response regulator [Pseudomonadota bacterium]MBU4035503.1 response regulator [Pseudomonadota bacterium]